EEIGFLHEFILLDPPASRLTLEWDGPAVLCELTPLGAGTPPAWVQRWRPPEGRADLLLFSTHADDEHLFFGGILPRTAADGRYEIQVAYLVNHNDEPYRPHELLNGLWEVGVRRYPIIPDFPDRYSGSLAHAKTIYDAQALIDYQVGLIRRFSPQVIVGQDLNGEYGHGMHMLGAHCLLESVPLAAEGAQGWNTPKLYLHLYPHQQILLNYDAPLAAFEGKTAFQMAVAGFAKHKSQQSFFAVEQWGPYDCRKFGLARTTVGPDEHKDDLFEHLISYSEQLRFAEAAASSSQAAAEAEAERIRQEALTRSAAAEAQRTRILYLPDATSDRLYAWIGSPAKAALALGGIGLSAAAL
ncbi:MAG: PIG-L family deacetylase, partial [Oscillospiraceae bacterium]